MIEIRPTGAALGAEIGGVDLAGGIDDDTLGAIRAAWWRHLVLLFRGQNLAPERLVAFARRLGPLDTVPGWRDAHPPGAPEILVISNVEADGRPIGVLGAGEAEWHSDMSYMEAPPTASVLSAVEVPAVGGNTSFLNMYAALDGLDAAQRAALEGRLLHHDASRDSTGNPRPGVRAAGDPDEAVGVSHPILRRHPESGRAALYLGRRTGARVVGMAAAESDELLDALWAHCCRDDYVWTHRWRAGDVLMWDNRCTMHKRDAFDAAARRIMHRAQIKGERPA